MSQRASASQELRAISRQTAWASLDAYNRTVGSLEGRVLLAVRRFQELGAAGGRRSIPWMGWIRGFRGVALTAGGHPVLSLQRGAGEKREKEV